MLTGIGKAVSAHAALVDEISRALEESDQLHHSLQLIRLVDGVYTYTLSYNDGSDAIEVSSTDEAYEHIGNKKRLRQAQAVLSAVMSFGWRIPQIQNDQIDQLRLRIDRLVDPDHRVRNAELRAIAAEKRNPNGDHQ